MPVRYALRLAVKGRNSFILKLTAPDSDDMFGLLPQAVRRSKRTYRMRCGFSRDWIPAFAGLTVWIFVVNTLILFKIPLTLALSPEGRG